MTTALEGSGFWLPSDFLTDDDFLIDKHYFTNAAKPNPLCFPTEFPYDFPSNPVELDRLQKLLACSSAGNGSPNAVLTPPLPDAVGDLFYRTAGQVAKLKLNVASGFVPEQKIPFAHPRTHSHQNVMNTSLLMPLQKPQMNESSGVWKSQQHMYHNRGMTEAGRERAVLWGISRGAAPAKKPCAGTGVFLPRRYGSDGDRKSHSLDAHKKQGYSPAVFPAAPPPNSQTNKFDSINSLLTRPQPVPMSGRVYAHDYDLMMARRRAALLQRQRSLLASLIEERHDAYLPQEWTY